MGPAPPLAKTKPTSTEWTSNIPRRAPPGKNVFKDDFAQLEHILRSLTLVMAIDVESHFDATLLLQSNGRRHASGTLTKHSQNKILPDADKIGDERDVDKTLTRR